MNRHYFRTFGFAITFLLIGCASWFGGITYYDSTTYKNLTDLKPEVIMFYESFATSSVDLDWLKSIRLKFAQIYEYEKGKGIKNKETYEQIKIIREMFERHVTDRLEKGQWNIVHLNNNIQTISEAFDIAIATERLKNKNE